MDVGGIAQTIDKAPRLGSLEQPLLGVRLAPAVLEAAFIRSHRMGCGFAVDDAAKRDLLRFLPIGTKEMMRAADAMLQQLGFPMPQYVLLRKKNWAEGESRP